jgi:hypothetical protein
LSVVWKSSAAPVLGALVENIVLADFFMHDFGKQRCDVVYEQIFLCSLPPKRWPAGRERRQVWQLQKR